MADNRNIVEDEKRKDDRFPDLRWDELQEDLEMELDEGPGKYPVR